MCQRCTQRPYLVVLGVDCPSHMRMSGSRLEIRIEDILLNAANGREFSFSDEFRREISDDVDLTGLNNEFITLRSFIVESFPHIKEVTSIETILEVFRSNKFKTMMAQTRTLLQLYLTIPMSNASADRGFSDLRRVKTYLRNRLTQEHLNHQLMLHVHKEITDGIDIESIARSFVSVNGQW